MIAQPRLVIRVVAVVAAPSLGRVGKLSDRCRIVINFQRYINYDNFIVESLGSVLVVFA